MKLTCHVWFTDPLKNVDIKNRAQHSLEYANLWAQPKGEEHGEEEDGPDGGSRKLDYCLGKYNEC